MGAATNQTTAKQIIELIKMLVPVFTFFAGLAVGIIRDWLKARKEFKNIKAMLIKELEENLKMLDGFDRSDIEEDYSLSIALAFILKHLSSSIYSHYLGSLHRFESEEMDAIYEAYIWITGIRRIGVKLYAKELYEGKYTFINYA